MARREGQGVEVVTRRLDLATVDDRVAEAEKDVLHLAADLRDRMQVAALPPSDGKRHIHPLLGEPAVEIGAAELVLAGGERGLETLAKGVQRDAGLAVANVAKGLLDRALPAKVLDACGVHVVHRGRRRDGCESLRL